MPAHEAPFAPRPDRSAEQSGERRSAEDSDTGIQVTIAGAQVVPGAGHNVPWQAGPSRPPRPSGGPRHRAPAAPRNTRPRNNGTRNVGIAAAGTAVAIATVIVVAATIGPGENGQAQAQRRPSSPAASVPAQPPEQPAQPAPQQPDTGPLRPGPLANGWRQIRPVTDPSVTRCLGVGSNRFAPTLVQSSCSTAPIHAYYIELIGNGIYQIKPRETRGIKNPCVTVSGITEGSLLLLTPCSEGATNQHFSLRAAGRSRQYGTLYRLRPLHTRDQNMCVDLLTDAGSKLANGLEAVQLKCSLASRSQRLAFPAP